MGWDKPLRNVVVCHPCCSILQVPAGQERPHGQPNVIEQANVRGEAPEDQRYDGDAARLAQVPVNLSDAAGRVNNGQFLEGGNVISRQVFLLRSTSPKSVAPSQRACPAVMSGSHCTPSVAWSRLAAVRAAMLVHQREAEWSPNMLSKQRAQTRRRRKARWMTQ